MRPVLSMKPQMMSLLIVSALLEPTTAGDVRGSVVPVVVVLIQNETLAVLPIRLLNSPVAISSPSPSSDRAQASAPVPPREATHVGLPFNQPALSPPALSLMSTPDGPSFNRQSMTVVSNCRPSRFSSPPTTPRHACRIVVRCCCCWTVETPLFLVVAFRIGVNSSGADANT